MDPGIVRFDSAIEPLVRLFEDTPRAKLLEEVGARIRKGLGYRESLAALLLAGIRNIQPRPAVGFKFHAVLVVHSAHLVAQASPQADRRLPLLWAVDHFKESQADDVREGDWTMGAVDAKSVPAKAQAVRVFTTAMDNWDEASADAAAAGLARHLTPEESFEIFARYAVRDFRSIGHKAIYVANAWRTLDTIGWQHSEPYSAPWPTRSWRAKAATRFAATIVSTVRRDAIRGSLAGFGRIGERAASIPGRQSRCLPFSVKALMKKPLTEPSI